MLVRLWPWNISNHLTTTSMALLSASLLAANLTYLSQELISIEGMVQSLHLDIMDGKAVPTTGLELSTIKLLPVSWKKEVHLMVIDPATVMNSLKDIVIDVYYVGVEAWKKKETLPHVASEVGLVLNPDDLITENSSSIQLATIILIMGVVPGWSGHVMLEDTFERVRQVRVLCPNAQIVVDGGVNEKNAQELVRAGADKLVIGSYLFKASDRNAAVKLLTNW